MPPLLSYVPDSQLSKWRAISIYASTVITLIGSLVLAGWFFNLSWLRNILLVGTTSMRTGAAASFVAAGLFLLLTISPVERRSKALDHFKFIAAVVPLLIGAIALLQSTFDESLALGQFFAPSEEEERIGINAAVNFVLTGLALLALKFQRSRARWFQGLAFAIGTIALQALIGYVYGVRLLYQIDLSAPSMAFPTAIAFIGVAIALLCIAPDQGLMKSISSPLVGGIVARRILLVILIFPLLLGWLVLQGWKLGWYDVAFAISGLVLILILISSVFIWKTAKILNREDRQRRDAEGQLKTALETLQDREDRISRLADANIIGILFGDVEGGIHRANDELLRIIGYTQQELEAGQINWIDITPPEFLPLDEMHVAEAQARGACTPYEKEYIRRDGQRVPVLIGYVLVGEKRRDSIAFIVDLRERRRLEDSLRQRTEELERVNRLKDEFLAVLSHELRTPLNPILGWAQMLKTQRLDTTKAAQALETIERNAKLQLTLIDELLDVSRILQGKLNLRAAPVDLAAVVEGAISTVYLAAESKAISIDFLHDPQPVMVRGDSDRLQQVVWNVLSNAVKFTPASGNVTIHLSTSPTEAKLTISDTGRGISASFLPYVFDNFRQEDGSSTRSFGGLGLGLAIAKHLIELHGGVIQANSLGEGKGATFTIKLPLLSEQLL
ncbi:ATP-binding protein [Leptolyngbya boryana CZ1]|uniref:histidine kinase n=1 Tax=Leptolyngbya boryana CZ1 TaxID=3060204 RepID=A0AA96X1X7_LEPBY|nr:ATP-binding protein [Leptolyngbya boryana]WNZ48329.1 ATP-binding protein [Leptolyngbya boryana CZ1]